MIDQDEAARSVGEGAKETEREQEKLGLQIGKKAGPLKRGDNGHWRGYGGRSALVRSVCTVMQVETWTSELGSKPGLSDPDPLVCAPVRP